MPWRKITRYGFVWSQATNRFNVDLWFSQPTPGFAPNPEHRFVNLGAEEFNAICTMMRSDTDRQLYCDPQTNQLSTGVELL